MRRTGRYYCGPKKKEYATTTNVSPVEKPEDLPFPTHKGERYLEVGGVRRRVTVVFIDSLCREGYTVRNRHTACIRLMSLDGLGVLLGYTILLMTE